MEAASRPTLELLADLPVEEPLDTAGSPRAPASVAQASAAPANGQDSPTAGKSLESTGIEFINPETLFGPDAHLASAPPEPPAPPTLSAPAKPRPARGEPELTLADPTEVDRLLTRAPAPSPTPAAKPMAAAATGSPPPPTPSPAAAMVPLASTASLSAAATKLAAAARQANRAAPKPNAPNGAAPAPPTAKAPGAEAAPVKTPAAEAPSLASWASAREAAAPARNVRPPAAAAAPVAPLVKSTPPVRPAAAPVAARAPAPAAASAPIPRATPSAAAAAVTAAPMDRDFIARNQVVERYLSGRLPLKGATDFERFCHDNPQLLDEIGLPERVNAGLRLLEASGKPEPWQEKATPAWQKPQVTIGLAAVVAVLCLTLLMVGGSNAGKNRQITALNKQMLEQALDPATSTREIRVLPSRSGASNTPAITIGGGAAQLADLKIDESRSPYHSFRLTIDRIDQGRVAIITNVGKDSNGNLRLALNSSALGPGAYQFTIEGINWRGEPEPDSWVTIGVAR
ncbi:MAG TPA: hypothetical protein VK676_14195 [Steroidobacteraceae bacterium]|nr:hypothetical protein [Steroidobacteraceae bacterium]